MKSTGMALENYTNND